MAIDRPCCCAMELRDATDIVGPLWSAADLPMLSGSTVAVTAEQLLDRFVASAPRQRRSLLPQLRTRQQELVGLIEEIAAGS